MYGFVHVCVYYLSLDHTLSFLVVSEWEQKTLQTLWTNVVT